MTPRDADLPSASQAPRLRASSFSPTLGNVSRSSASVLSRRGDSAETRQLRHQVAELTRPYPGNSLIASAKRLTSKKLKGGSFKKTTALGWQEDAWEMHDLVGEQHFLATTLANQAAKARFYVGVLGEGDDATDIPEPAEDPALQEILKQVGGSPQGFSQMVQRMCVNLFVAGDGWLVGIPKQLLPDYEPEDPDEELPELPELYAIQDPEDETELSMEDLEWRMMSVSEVGISREGTVKLHLGESAEEKIDVSPDLLYMIRVWRAHPRRWWEADSPTRSSLPVLRELVGLTMHISAQVDSRLAGAGLLLVPASAARALKIAAGIPEDSPDDPFTDALMEAMLTPIGDRSNASALVPLVVTIPDGTTQDFLFMSFAKPLDTEAKSLREEAIRRLALGQDAPPELLLGTAGMNHWGAWLVRDDVVSTHIEPPLALIADALTTQYLRPMMAELGYNAAKRKQHVVWYDTSDMIVQPNKAADAMALYSVDALSDQALRAANGFDENDAPETSRMDLASQKAFAMVIENPALMANPGLPQLVNQLRALISGNPLELPKKTKADASAPVIPIDPATGQPISTTNPTAGQPAPPQLKPAAPVAIKPAAGAPPQNPSVAGGPVQPQGRAAASTITEALEAYQRLLEGNPLEGDAALVASAADEAQARLDAAPLYTFENGSTISLGPDPSAAQVMNEALDDGTYTPTPENYLFQTSEENWRAITEDERKKLSDEGKAMPDGSYPIANVSDLRNAIQAIGRAKDPGKVKAHIKRRAKELGQEKLIPDTWAVTDDEYVRELPGGGWDLSDKAVEDVMAASFTDHPMPEEAH